MAAEPVEFVALSVEPGAGRGEHRRGGVGVLR